MKMKLKLTLLLFVWQSAAVAASTDPGEALVDDFLGNVKTMQGHFEQSLIDSNGTVVEVSEGEMIIDRPSRFRWTYSNPYEQWLVADGRNIWSYDVDLAQVTVKPQAEALANTPAQLLGGASDALEQFRFDGTATMNETTWVRMRPVDDSSGFDRVELGFVDGQLSRMVFFDNLEQTTDVVFSDVRINEPIDAAAFDFVVPDDADLVGVPLASDDTSH
jgi:outer membrane lipoprotein carrier protein